MDNSQASKRIARLEHIAKHMRKDVLDMGLVAGSSGIHLGGSLSCIELIAALYFDVMRFDASSPDSPKNDRFIFSKGHGAPALYAAFHQLGLIADDEIGTFKQPNSFLSGHPSRNKKRGINISTGSLGQGLSLAVGICLGMRLNKNINNRCFVLLGDGELNEGSIWEAAMSAAHYNLSNLTAIIDANILQYDGKTEDIMSLGDLASKWESFGWDTVEIDGHSFEELLPALQRHPDKPLAIIAHTIKGKGAPFAENNATWHNSNLTQKLYDEALDALHIMKEEN